MGLWGGAAQADNDNEYRPPVLAKVLHSLPHINVSLHRVNSTFNPNSKVYIESLGILASVPAAWLIFSLTILLIWLTTRCCDRRPRPARSIAALKLALATGAIMCAAATGLGLYANDDLHNGLMTTFTAANNLNNIVSNVRNQTDTIMIALTQKVGPQLQELGDIFDSPVANQTALGLLLSSLSAVRQNNSQAIRAAADIQRPLKGVSLGQAISLGEHWEMWRWPVTMGVLSVLLVLCVVLLVGVARHSRRCLIMFSVFGLFCAAGAWLLAGAGLAGAVALADLCVAPEQYAASVAAQSGLPPELLHYYTHCETARANPFTQRLRESQNAVAKMRVGLGSVARFALDLFKDRGLQPKLSALSTEVNAADRGLASLAALLDCRGLHAQWLAGARGLCWAALPGLALLLLSAALSGFLLTVLVWLDSHTWIYLRKRRDYSTVDESDPFLPSSAASQAVAARTLQPRSQGSCQPSSSKRSHADPLPAVRTPSPRTTPPPSYAAALMHDDDSVFSPNAPQFCFDDQPDGCDGRSLTLGRGAEHHHRHAGLPAGTGGGHLAHLGSGHHTHRSTHTLGRLPSHASHHDHIGLSGPNNGKYATLSKQCKTLESSDFY